MHTGNCKCIKWNGIWTKKQEKIRKIQCNWSDTIEGKDTVYCQETETVKDDDNVNIRYFCITHMKKVKEIRDIMFKNYLLNILKNPNEKNYDVIESIKVLLLWLNDKL